MRRRFDTIETVALVSVGTLLGSTAAPCRPPIPMPRWSAGSVASPEAQRAGQFLREVSREWQEVVELDAASTMEWDELTTAKVLENLAFAPPESTAPVHIVITGVRQGKPHSVSMEEFDYELIESLSGEL